MKKLATLVVLGLFSVVLLGGCCAKKCGPKHCHKPCGERYEKISKEYGCK